MDDLDAAFAALVPAAPPSPASDGAIDAAFVAQWADAQAFKEYNFVGKPMLPFGCLGGFSRRWGHRGHNGTPLCDLCSRNSTDRWIREGKSTVYLATLVHNLWFRANKILE